MDVYVLGVVVGPPNRACRDGNVMKGGCGSTKQGI